MSCSTNLRTDHLSGADTGGSWVYDGHSASVGGPFSIGAWTPGTLTGDNPSVDWTSATPGFHALTYSGGSGGCFAETQIVVEVLAAPNAGTNTTVEKCDDDGAFTMFDEIGGSPDNTGEFGGSATAEAAYNAGGAGPTDDTFDPSTAGAGTYNFTYTVTNTPTTGSIDPNCANCNIDSITYTVNVTAAFEAGSNINVAVCN